MATQMNTVCARLNRFHLCYVNSENKSLRCASSRLQNYVRKALTQKTFVALVIAEVLFPDQFRRENVVEKSRR